MNCRVDVLARPGRFDPTNNFRGRLTQVLRVDALEVSQTLNEQAFIRAVALAQLVDRRAQLFNNAFEDTGDELAGFSSPPGDPHHHVRDVQRDLGAFITGNALAPPELGQRGLGRAFDGQGERGLGLRVEVVGGLCDSPYGHSPRYARHLVVHPNHVWVAGSGEAPEVLLGNVVVSHGQRSPSPLLIPSRLLVFWRP
jgi:hypothetical protein